MLTFLFILVEILFLALIDLGDGLNGGNLLPSILVALVCFVYAFEGFSKKKDRQFFWIIYFGFLLRILLMFFDIYGRNIYSLPNSGADSEVFYKQAVAYYNGSNGFMFEFSKNMGIVMKIIGTSRVYNQFLLMMCGVISLNILLKICKEIKLPTYYIMLTLCLGSFLPNFAIISSIFLRESIPTMFISISTLMFIKWYKNNKVVNLLLAFICVLCASYFHSGCIALFVAYVLIILLYNNKIKCFNFSFKGVFFSIVFGLVFVYLYNNYGDVFFGKMQGKDTLEEIAATRTIGGSNYAKYVGNSDNILNFIIYTPIRMFYFTFSPFVWQWRGLSDIIAFLFNALFAILTFIFVIRAIGKKGQYHNLLISLFIMWLCCLFVFSWGTTTTGTAVRHRDKFVIIEIVLFVCSIFDIKNKECRFNNSF